MHRNREKSNNKKGIRRPKITPPPPPRDFWLEGPPETPEGKLPTFEMSPSKQKLFRKQLFGSPMRSLVGKFGVATGTRTSRVIGTGTTSTNCESRIEADGVIEQHASGMKQETKPWEVALAQSTVNADKTLKRVMKSYQKRQNIMGGAGKQTISGIPYLATKFMHPLVPSPESGDSHEKVQTPLLKTPQRPTISSLNVASSKSPLMKRLSRTSLDENDKKYSKGAPSLPLVVNVEDISPISSTQTSVVTDRTDLNSSSKRKSSPSRVSSARTAESKGVVKSDRAADGQEVAMREEMNNQDGPTAGSSSSTKEDCDVHTELGIKNELGGDSSTGGDHPDEGGRADGDDGRGGRSLLCMVQEHLDGDSDPGGSEKGATSLGDEVGQSTSRSSSAVGSSRGSSSSSSQSAADHEPGGELGEGHEEEGQREGQQEEAGGTEQLLSINPRQDGHDEGVENEESLEHPPADKHEQDESDDDESDVEITGGLAARLNMKYVH